MSIQQQFNKFHDAIKLTRENERYKEAREKDDCIKIEIKAAFKEAGYPIVDDFIQGSMADGVNTGIVSIYGNRDIDRALVIEAEKAPEDPLEPKKILRDTLKKRGFANPEIKKPCVTADYVNNDLHFDYPIYRRNSSGGLELAVGREFSTGTGKKWEPNDPKGLINHLKNPTGDLTPLEKDQMRRIARYMKRWRDVQYQSDKERKKVYSIGLTLMTTDSFSKQISEDGVANDLLALRETLYSIINYKSYFTLTDYQNHKYDIKVLLPVSPWRDIFENHGSSVGTLLRSKFVKLLNKCDEALAEEDTVKQSEILQGQFGEDFPIAEKSVYTKKNVYVGSGIVADHGGA